MASLYSNMNKIKFTSISESYKVDPKKKGKISELHSKLITYVTNNFKNTRKYKQQVVDALNLITYVVYADEPLPFSWSLTKPLDSLPEMDKDLIEDTLSNIFLTVDSIEWDLDPNMDSTSNYNITEPIESKSTSSEKSYDSKKQVEGSTHSPKQSKGFSKLSRSVFVPTNKEDLYIQSPSVPQFDYNNVWLKGNDGADQLAIYVTLPEIPTKQNEISVTTDVDSLTRAELLRLFPNVVIPTRSSVLCGDPIEGLDYEPDIGVLVPIEGFTREQIVDNIIKFPHFYKLTREIDGKLENFYNYIEIDGELFKVLDVWDSLPDTQSIPRKAEFIKEYVVRRYLLEKHVKGIEHKYPMFGNLEPFLTLFMPADMYAKKGYTDPEFLARQCVLSRVSYKKSRNPILRRLNYE